MGVTRRRGETYFEADGTEADGYWTVTLLGIVEHGALEAGYFSR